MAKVKKGGAQQAINPFNESEALVAADAAAVAQSPVPAEVATAPLPIVPGGLSAEELALAQAEADSKAADYAAEVASAASNGQPVKTPRERFVALAAKRTQKVMTALNALARCGNRKQYEYTDAESSKVLSAVEGAYKALKEAFDPTAGTKKKATFTL